MEGILNVEFLKNNRWVVVIGALMVQFALGAIYAWSVFTPDLGKAPFNFTPNQTQGIFSAGLAAFALMMIVAGQLQMKFGPRMMTMIGGFLLGLGYVLAGMFGHTFIAQLVCIGLIGGSGIGLAYVCPIAVGMKWFPDKKGLITGLAVAGFGFGATAWVMLAPTWANAAGVIDVLKVFTIYGCIFFALVELGSIVMVNPPADWAPAGWSGPKSSTSGKTIASVEFSSSEMVRTPQFYMLWLTFVFSALAGLMVIGIIKLFGIDALQERSGMTEKAASAAAGVAMAVFYALANGLGRIVWGAVSDKIGRKTSIIIMTAFQGVMMVAFYLIGGSVGLLFAGATIVGFNFGGNFALFPAITADFFGTKSVGRNYGWLFTAYGIGGIVGPMMAGHFKAIGKGHGVTAWMPAFMIAGALCIVASIITILIKPPVKAAILTPVKERELAGVK
jgi:OFA family oxalate/formate antiporter-like MFS transporter